jgi:hypothetical protein
VWGQLDALPTAYSRRTCRLAFTACGSSLWALTTDGDVLRFCCATGALAQRIMQPHRHSCSVLLPVPSGCALLTGGADGLVKVWALDGTADSDNGSGRCSKSPAGGLLALTAARAAAAATQQAREAPVLAHQSFVGHPGAVEGEKGARCGPPSCTTPWRARLGALVACLNP